MRQSLMALSDKICDSSLKHRVLNLAIQDVLTQWNSSAQVIFASVDSFLEYLIAFVSYLPPSPSTLQAKPNSEQQVCYYYQSIYYTDVLCTLIIRKIDYV